eukprot:TRINITY_DN614_c0_g1_i1.p1 TRINITY_DN614_c0_g1~~TRINITY_DN614_c0_g1_i1.p1  ORF type:complete len:109 (-),score=9.46 TRINITY_DN614_c0_g1_i1:70-396(-)
MSVKGRIGGFFDAHVPSIQESNTLVTQLFQQELVVGPKRKEEVRLRHFVSRNHVLQGPEVPRRETEQATGQFLNPYAAVLLKKEGKVEMGTCWVYRAANLRTQWNPHY